MITLSTDVEWSFVQDPNGLCLCIFDEGLYSPPIFESAIRNTLKQIGLSDPNHFFVDTHSSDGDMMVVRIRDEEHLVPIKMLLMSRRT